MADTRNKKRIAWNKGKTGIYSKETLKKMSAASSGRKVKPEVKLKISKTLKEKHAQGEVKTQRNVGEKHPMWKGGLPKCADCGTKLSTRKNTLGVCKQCYVSSLFGEKSPAWKGGITPLALSLRVCVEYKMWRSAVFTRDDYTCQHCKARGVELHADHIKPFSHILHINKVKTYEQAVSCKELWDVTNGRTLCKPCHMNTETWGCGSNSKKVKEKIYV